MLRASSGATIDTIMRATGWQQHSVRGFLAAVVRKKLGLDLLSKAADGGRVYRINDHTTLSFTDSPGGQGGLMRCGVQRRFLQSRIGSSLEGEIAHLRGLDLNGLRALWRSITGRKAPPHLSRQLLFAIIAYRIQAEALSDLDAETVRLLKKIGSGGTEIDVVPLTDALDQRRLTLLPGTVLTREWNRQTYRVMVVKEGFAFEGRTCDSLSTIAFAITGTKWNGPRFFGLRDKKVLQAKP
jgi:hypothetical protein